MKICFIPIDDRPVCYDLAKDIAAIDDSVTFYIPPKEFLGNLTKSANIEALLDWLENFSECDVVILSLDTVAYGGLIPSRRGVNNNGELENFDEIKKRLERLKHVLKGKMVYAFSSIMRISNNNCNEEEKEYWSEWGQKIFQFSYNNSPLIFKEAELYNASQKAGIPTEIIEDYIKNRKRNFEVNKLYLQWKQEGVFDTLIFSKDDCAEHGFNVEEARAIENLGGKTKTGADEIPLSLLARAIKKEIRVFVKYLEPDYKNCISNYEDISIEKSVLGQLELGGFTSVKDEAEADIILIVNNFVEKQGELVMGWDTPGKFKNNFIEPEKPYAVADVRYANGADNDFIEYFLPKINLKNFYGYSGWNTSANTLGSLLAAIKVKWNAKKYNDDAFKRLEMIRFLDDWAYQANIRTRITEPVGISDLMRPYEDKIAEVLKIKSPQSISYTYPWNRKFEIRVNIKTA